MYLITHSCSAHAQHLRRKFHGHSQIGGRAIRSSVCTGSLGEMDAASRPRGALLESHRDAHLHGRVLHTLRGRRRLRPLRHDILQCLCASCLLGSSAQAGLLAESSWPPSFRRRSAYRNLSVAMGAAGCSGAPGFDSRLPPWELAAGRVACALGCQEHEQVLDDAFAPWWDHELDVKALDEACTVTGRRYREAYIGAVVGGRLKYACCGSPKMCNDDPEDVEPFLAVLAEIARATRLPDMYFLFNVGDQPFADHVYWSPLPQFHWVRSAGHWTIPMPNPYHVRAHFGNNLGDSDAHVLRLVPWEQRSPRVFWRGQLSAPDNILPSDPGNLPRVRLMRIAERHPEIFDVGFVDVDDEIFERVRRRTVKEWLNNRALETKVDMLATLPRYRYAINVAAVLSSWRLAELLGSGCVLLLQSHMSSELIYEWLTPWEHFVPISYDLSDLMDKVRWLEAHPQNAREIAERGLELFRRRVRRQDTYCYVMQAMNALARTLGLHRGGVGGELRTRTWTMLGDDAIDAWVGKPTSLRAMLEKGSIDAKLDL